MAKKKRKASAPYAPQLEADLKDPMFAAQFLSEVFAEGGNSDEDFVVFFDAFETIFKAQGFSLSAKATNMSRDALYKAFKKHRNPTVKNFRAILNAADMDLAFVPRKRA